MKSLLRFAKQHLRHNAALRRATGGDFNIFRVLGIRHYEVQTHSPVLAELLNPAGAHGQGEIFLQLFLKHLGIAEFRTTRANVRREVFCDKNSPSHGRRIDIVLEDTNRRRIFIENKITASDQHDQLLSYRKHDSEATILYLTLFGDNPSNVEENQYSEIRYRCISYQTEVLRWLESCRREAASLPVIRETLTQYIHLIRELTQQSTTRKMNEELIEEIVKDDESYEAFLAIINARTAVEEKLIANLLQDLEKVAKEMGLLFELEEKPFSHQYGGFGFHSENLKNHGLALRFQFDKTAYRDPYYGFCRVVKESELRQSGDLLEAFRKFDVNVETDGNLWPAWAYMPAELGGWASDNFKVIRSGRFTEEVQTRLKALLQIAEEVFSSKTEEAVLKSDMVS